MMNGRSVFMKSVIFLKLPILLCALVGAVVLVPSAKAQSEINPDHFDGTDSWDTRTKAEVAAKSHQAPEAAPAQTQNKKPTATVELAVANARPNPAPPGLGAIENKRKAAAQNPSQPTAFHQQH